MAHCGGATIWGRGERRWKSTKLAWTGSHIGVIWSPNGKSVVTVMQENALYGWRLRNKADMRMSGYPAKPRALDWVGNAPHLATSGADQAICWPSHFKDGPMGQAPLCVAHGGKQLATMVRGLPALPAVLVGFQDGTVLMSELNEAAEASVLRGTTGSEVTAIAVTRSLSHVLVGDPAQHIQQAALLHRRAREDVVEFVDHEQAHPGRAHHTNGEILAHRDGIAAPTFQTQRADDGAEELPLKATLVADGASSERWKPASQRLCTSIASVSHGRWIGARVSSRSRAVPSRCRREQGTAGCPRDRPSD